MTLNHSSMLVDESPLILLPSLAVTLGVNHGLFLQQIHYWLNPKHNRNVINGRHWVYNSYKQWKDQFPFWSEHTIRRIVEKLQDLGVLESFVTRDLKTVKYYTINYDRLNELKSTGQSNGSEPSDLKDSLDDDSSFSDWQLCPKQSVHDCQSALADLDRHYNKDPETTSEITLPPLTPPSPISEEGRGQGIGEDENFQSLVEEWSRCIQHPLGSGQSVFLTSKRKESLKALLPTLRHSGFTWSDFCQKIASSRFLMGQNDTGFRVSFDWAINPNNALKICENTFYDKPQSTLKTPPKTWSEVSDELQSSFLSAPHGYLWLQACERLSQTLGVAAVLSWFKNTALHLLDESQAIVLTDTAFKQNHLSTKYKLYIERALRSLVPSLQTLQFQVKEPA